MKKFLVPIALLFTFHLTNAQILTGLTCNNTDGLKQWNVDTDIEDETNILELIWNIDHNWGEWQINLRGNTGHIKLKWKDDPSEWEIKLNNKTVSCRRNFKDDPREWRISDGTTTIEFRPKHGSDWNEWISDDAHGVLYMYTEIENDPRQWIIQDDTQSTTTNPAMKIAMIFIAMIHSIPR
jgi:hypothetical protein